MRRDDAKDLQLLELLSAILCEKNTTRDADGQRRKTKNISLLLQSLLKQAFHGKTSANKLLRWARKELPRAMSAAHGGRTKGVRIPGNVVHVPQEILMNDSPAELEALLSRLEDDEH